MNVLQTLAELSKQSAEVVTQQNELERLSQQNQFLYSKYIQEKEQRIQLELDQLRLMQSRASSSPSLRGGRGSSSDAAMAAQRYAPPGSDPTVAPATSSKAGNSFKTAGREVHAVAYPPTRSFQRMEEHHAVTRSFASSYDFSSSTSCWRSVNHHHPSLVGNYQTGEQDRKEVRNSREYFVKLALETGNLEELRALNRGWRGSCENVEHTSSTPSGRGGPGVEVSQSQTGAAWIDVPRGRGAVLSGGAAAAASASCRGSMTSMGDHDGEDDVRSRAARGGGGPEATNSVASGPPPQHVNSCSTSPTPGGGLDGISRIASAAKQHDDVRARLSKSSAGTLISGSSSSCRMPSPILAVESRSRGGVEKMSSVSKSYQFVQVEKSMQGALSQFVPLLMGDGGGPRPRELHEAQREAIIPEKTDTTPLENVVGDCGPRVVSGDGCLGRNSEDDDEAEFIRALSRTARIKTDRRASSGARSSRAESSIISVSVPAESTRDEEDDDDGDGGGASRSARVAAPPSHHELVAESADEVQLVEEAVDELQSVEENDPQEEEGAEEERSEIEMLLDENEDMMDVEQTSSGMMDDTFRRGEPYSRTNPKLQVSTSPLVEIQPDPAQQIFFTEEDEVGDIHLDAPVVEPRPAAEERSPVLLSGRQNDELPDSDFEGIISDGETPMVRLNVGGDEKHSEVGGPPFPPHVAEHELDEHLKKQKFLGSRKNVQHVLDPAAAFDHHRQFFRARNSFSASLLREDKISDHSRIDLSGAQIKLDSSVGHSNRLSHNSHLALTARSLDASSIAGVGGYGNRTKAEIGGANSYWLDSLVHEDSALSGGTRGAEEVEEVENDQNVDQVQIIKQQELRRDEDEDGEDCSAFEDEVNLGSHVVDMDHFSAADESPASNGGNVLTRHPAAVEREVFSSPVVPFEEDFADADAAGIEVVSSPRHTGGDADLPKNRRSKSKPFGADRVSVAQQGNPTLLCDQVGPVLAGEAQAAGSSSSSSDRSSAPPQDFGRENHHAPADTEQERLLVCSDEWSSSDNTTNVDEEWNTAKPIDLLSSAHEPEQVVVDASPPGSTGGSSGAADAAELMNKAGLLDLQSATGLDLQKTHEALSSATGLEDGLKRDLMQFLHQLKEPVPAPAEGDHSVGEKNFSANKKLQLTSTQPKRSILHSVEEMVKQMDEEGGVGRAVAAKEAADLEQCALVDVDPASAASAFENSLLRDASGFDARPMNSKFSAPAGAEELQEQDEFHPGDVEMAHRNEQDEDDEVLLFSSPTTKRRGLAGHGNRGKEYQYVRSSGGIKIEEGHFAEEDFASIGGGRAGEREVEADEGRDLFVDGSIVSPPRAADLDDDLLLTAVTSPRLSSINRRPMEEEECAVAGAAAAPPPVADEPPPERPNNLLSPQLVKERKKFGQTRKNAWLVPRDSLVEVPLAEVLLASRNSLQDRDEFLQDRDATATSTLLKAASVDDGGPEDEVQALRTTTTSDVDGGGASAMYNDSEALMMESCLSIRTGGRSGDLGMLEKSPGSSGCPGSTPTLKNFDLSSIQGSWTTLQQARMRMKRVNPEESIEFSKSILHKLDNLDLF